MKRVNLMIFRLFVLTIGFGLAVSGGISSIAYLNLIVAGHGLDEYLAFISRRVECYFLPAGVGIIWLSIYWPHNNDIN
ncbi:hypothetical protein [Bacillus sp. ISL-55]|uniref:hypothetical protein n=1 Tax=Bacillus sp. ISL-55 TaxID=2819134 RepID=UPI0025705AF6|nr:hypothetical protein [Bacillus sp. ISL-55]